MRVRQVVRQNRQAMASFMGANDVNGQSDHNRTSAHAQLSKSNSHSLPAWLKAVRLSGVWRWIAMRLADHVDVALLVDQHFVIQGLGVLVLLDHIGLRRLVPGAFFAR